MATYTLTTSPQRVGRISLTESGSNNDRTFAVLAYYTNGSTTTSREVVIQLRFDSNGNVSGTGKCKVNSFANENFSFSRNSTTTVKKYSIDYDPTTGQSRDNSLKVQLSNMSARWSDGTTFNATPQNTVNTSFDLPDIDPVPTISITGLQIQSDGYPDNNGSAVSSISTLRMTMDFSYAQTAVLTVNGAGVTRDYSIAVTKASSETKTQDIPLTDFASSTDFTLTFTLTASNNTGSVSATATESVKGYFLPTYGSGTDAIRCNSNGDADSHGTYGKLHLTWNVATVLSTNPNTLQTCTTKLNGSTISPVAGSIANGYLDYLFPLAINEQGNLEIILEDKIHDNTITSFVVSKETMPLSIYQSGDSVGVSIGRMATSSGFWCYEDFYLKGESHNTIYKIYVDSNGQLQVIAI